MSLLNKFSVTYNLEQKSKRRRQSMSNHSFQDKKPSRPDILRKEVAEVLIKLGYDIDTNDATQRTSLFYSRRSIKSII